MYYFIFIIGFIFQLFNKKLLYIILLLLLLLFAALRFGIGVDYFSYEYLYNRLATNPIDEFRYGLDNQEVGFRVLGSLFKSFDLHYQVYLTFLALVNIIFIAKISKEYSKNPTLSIFLYFSFYYLTWTFSGLRQGVVLAVGLYYLLMYIEKNKFIKLIIVSLLLSLIHSSALFLILLYGLSKINFRKNTLISLSFLSVLISILPVWMVIQGLSWIPFYYRIEPYLEVTYTINILDFQFIARVIFLILMFAVYEKYSEQGNIQRNIINIYILSMILYFSFQFSELAAARLAIYGKFLDIIILANILYLYKKSINRLIYIILIFILSFLYITKEIGAQVDRSVEKQGVLSPYPTIFNEENYDFKNRYDIS